jgi:pimeloyl-ACP methyl ester carboxylesterase
VAQGAVVILTMAAMGCSYGISVRRADGPHLLDAWRASVGQANELSPRTRQTLHRWDLDTVYDHDPAAAFARLQTLVLQEEQAELLFALAEICHVRGQAAEKANNPEALVDYYLCAGYAFHYLFDVPPRSINTFDPRFRLACDLYNAGLAKLIRAAQKVGRLDPRQQLVLPTLDHNGFVLSVVQQGFPWPSSEFGPLLFCADYEVVGLANQYQGYGLGVALIGTRVRAPEGAAAGAFYPHDVSFPVTAFFRFEGTIADLSARRAGRLELYNPMTIQNVRVQSWSIPLQTDLTTPLAYFLSRTDLDGIEYTGFLHADRVKDRTGIYMFEPYQPGKIPVIMVHGLLSSPLTWTTMFNDLRADPTLRNNFQFWFYLYPTGNPYLATAGDLRDTLKRLHAELDPKHQDPALDHMVLVGHSLGGLVSKLLTVESGDDFWRLGTKQPFTTVKFDPQTRAEVQHLFFFAPDPSIRRVVFIGTPHHGSSLSPSWPGRLADQFIHLPKQLMRTARDAAKEGPHLWSYQGKDYIPTSLDMLAPGDPALELLASRTPPVGVHYHSIIGEAFGSGTDSTDGVVPYTSAHLDGVDSEVTVPATHLNLQHHPRAVLEVWRILLEHLQEVRGRQGVAQVPRRQPTTNAPQVSGATLATSRER